jgi:hypothetical protein
MAATVTSKPQVLREVTRPEGVLLISQNNKLRRALQVARQRHRD